MQPQRVPFFRSEVLRHRADRLHGGVSLATPLAWQAICILLFVTLAITIAFLAMATYSRVETVAGTITLDKGVASIVPSRTGVISEVDVVEGQRVRAGQALVRVRSEEDMIGGDTAPSRILAALGDQNARLAAQRGLLLAVSGAEQARLREQIVGLAAELESLAHQIDDQRRLIEIANADYESARRVALNGYISRRDLEGRQSTAISRRQQLAQLEQLRAAKTASIAEARRTIVQSEASAQAQISNAQSERAALVQQMAQTDLARGYSITSPVDGIVTALTARPGQPAADRQQLMMIIPADAERRVELYVPSAAVGFIRRGQGVRLAIDAFPYQQFGTVRARVTDVSAATIMRSGPGGTNPVYLVTADLPRPWINAYGRRQSLAPGMTLAGRIVTENRSLIEWLFQPVFAVRNR